MVRSTLLLNSEVLYDTIRKDIEKKIENSIFHEKTPYMTTLSPSAPPTEAREREFFIWKSLIFTLKAWFFDAKMLWSWSGIIFEKSSNFQIFIIFSTFFWHISSPSPVFPWSNWAHIEPAQSSNIVFKVLLGICQSVKYFYQKYLVKESKLRTSREWSKISGRPA